MEKIWYVVVGGKPTGPFSAGEVREKLAREELTYAALIFKKGFERWKLLSDVEEFERREPKADSQVLPTREIDVRPQVDLAEGWVLLVKHDTAGQPHWVQSGPHSSESIREKLARKEAQFSDMIWKKGLSGWVSVGSLDDFDRRRPKSVTELAPKPAMVSSAPAVPTTPTLSGSTVEKVKEAVQKTDVPAESPKTGFKLGEGLADQPQDSREFKFEAKPEVESLAEGKSVTKPTPESESGEVPPNDLKKKFQRRRLALAVGGAATMMAVAAVGINAYKQVGSGKTPNIQAVVPPPPQPVTAVREVAQIPAAPTPPPPPPVNAVPSGVLKVVALKAETSHPQLAFETDLPGGQEITVEISASSGKILKFASFTETAQVSVTPGQMPTLDLSRYALPAGQYRVVAKSGTLQGSTSLSIGKQDAAFKARLAEFRKKLEKQQKVERAAVKKNFDSLSRSVASLNKSFARASGVAASGGKSKLEWEKLFKTWRKQFQPEAKEFKGKWSGVTPSTRNSYAYPEAFLKLKKGYSQTTELAKVYDQAIRSGRSIASVGSEDPALAVKKSLSEVKAEIKKMK